MSLKKYSETGKRMRIPRKHRVSSGYYPTSFNSLKTIVFLKIKIKYYVRILVLWITWAPSLLTVKSSLFDYHTSLSACYIRIQENRTLLMQARREGDRAPYMCVLFLCSVIGWFWHDMGQHSLTIWISLHVLEHLCFPTSDFHFQFYVSVC